MEKKQNMIHNFFTFGSIEKFFIISGFLDIITSLYVIDGIKYIETNPIFIFVNDFIHTWWGKIIFVLCYSVHILVIVFTFRKVAGIKNKILRKLLLYLYLYLGVHLIVLAVNNLLI